MKRLLLCAAILVAGCGKEPGPAAKSPPPPEPVTAPTTGTKVTADQLLAQAEQERAPALYEQAVAAFTALIESTSNDDIKAAAHGGRALARWRLSLMRGHSDPDVIKDLIEARTRRETTTLEALVQFVENAKARGGWEPLAPRILKETFLKAFPESSAFTTDWAALVRPPEGENQKICDALSVQSSVWPLARGIQAALEGRDVPEPGKEGILWILKALRQPAGEAMKTLEGATGPDNGILMQAQAQLLAAEGRFTEATGRMTIAPIPVLRAAANVAAGKPAIALESLGDDNRSPFAKTLRAAALLQTGTEASMAELDKLLDQVPVAYLKFERGIRRLAAGNRDGALDDLRAAAPAGGALSAAWLGFASWHLQDYDGAVKELERAAELKPEGDLAVAIEEIRGYALQAKGEDDTGAKQLVAAAAKRPTREIYFRLATHLRGNRQWKALQELAEVTARAIPSDPEPWAAKAEAAFWLKNYDASVETVTFALGQKIDPKRLLKWRGLSYEELGKVSEAHEDWDKLAELIPHEGDAFAHRAWMRAKLGRWADVKVDAEQGISRGANAWGQALARFALAAEALGGPPPEGEEADPESRKSAALEHLRLSVKTGAVEPSDLDKIQSTFKSLAGTEEWKKLVESSAEKQKELKDEAKRGGMLGVMLDHGGGSVAVTGTYRKSGARRAGLAPGDIILEVEGRRVSHVPDVSSILAGRGPGQEVKVKIERELRPKLKLVQVRTITLSNRDVFED